jgi:hypothetical protein
MLPGQRATDPFPADLAHPPALLGVVEQRGDQLREV